MVGGGGGTYVYMEIRTTTSEPAWLIGSNSRVMESN